MRERYQQILRLLCLVLGALLLAQLARIALNRNPLAHLQIPEVPTLTKTNAESASKATNAIPTSNLAKLSTNQVGSAAALKETNTTPREHLVQSATNASPGPAAQRPTTNSTATQEIAKLSTNALPVTPPAKVGTNIVAQVEPGKSGTNTQARTAGVSTNKPAASSPQVAGAASGMPPGMPGMMGPGMPGKLPDLPPEIWARVDRVVDSEILAPVMHPLPMALMGIAGDIAFLRASNGQTGLVKEGENLGDLKLLRIGINRVLVEEGGEKKELMIYSGMGGESLLPK